MCQIWKALNDSFLFKWKHWNLCRKLNCTLNKTCRSETRLSYAHINTYTHKNGFRWIQLDGKRKRVHNVHWTHTIVHDSRRFRKGLFLRVIVFVYYCCRFPLSLSSHWTIVCVRARVFYFLSSIAAFCI